MNMKKESRVELSKKAAALKPGDVFQAIGEDMYQYVVISRQDKYVRFMELQTKQFFTNSHYAIESFKGFKILGVLKKRHIMRLLTLGRVWYKIVQ